MALSTHGTLLAYSEWLDGQGLVAGEDASGDARAHDRLAADFAKEWTGEPLAGH